MMIENDLFQGAAEAIAKLVVATASDSDTVATITASNAKLTTHLEASQAYIKKLKYNIADLNMKIKPAWQGQGPFKTTNNDHYCRSHGIKSTVNTQVQRARIPRTDTMKRQ
jgi:hypothetical protein